MICGIVADDDRAVASRAELAIPFFAALLETRVANRQNLVENQDSRTALNATA